MPNWRRPDLARAFEPQGNLFATDVAQLVCHIDPTLLDIEAGKEAGAKQEPRTIEATMAEVERLLDILWYSRLLSLKNQIAAGEVVIVHPANE